MDSEAGRHSADVPFGGDDLLREPFATTNGSVAVITGVRDPEATTAPDPGSDETTSEEGPVDTSTAPMKGTEPTVIPIVKDVLSLVGDKWVLLGKEVPPEKGVGNKWQQFRRGNTSQYPESKQNTPIDGLGVTPRQIEKGNLSLRQVEGLIDVARGERARLLGEADTKRLEIYHDSLVKRLQHLVQTRGIRPIIAAEDGKSSTKTVTLLGMGAQFAKYTHVAVVLFPSTRSQGTVTAGSLSGAKLTENTITAKEFMLTSDQFETGR
ncbi:MAG TPA: hypothetical protein VF261_01670, partial [Candidatus Saccharimonadales bacterium]